MNCQYVCCCGDSPRLLLGLACTFGNWLWWFSCDGLHVIDYGDESWLTNSNLLDWPVYSYIASYWSKLGFRAHIKHTFAFFWNDLWVTCCRGLRWLICVYKVVFYRLLSDELISKRLITKVMWIKLQRFYVKTCWLEAINRDNLAAGAGFTDLCQHLCCRYRSIP